MEFHAKAPGGTIRGIGLSRARGPVLSCSLEPKAAWYLCFRVTDLGNAGVVVLKEKVECFITAIPVRVGQVFSAVAQKESGIQVSLDPPAIYDVVASGELFLCVGISHMVILAGPEGSGIHFQILAAQGFQLPFQRSAELGWGPGLQALPEPFPPGVFSVFLNF